VTTTDAELTEMLQAANRLRNGPARFAALDNVFRHADAAGRTRFAFRARLGALDNLHLSGEYTRSFMAFAWCLSTFDRHPEVANPQDEHTLLWRFKWIIAALPQFPGVPLDRTTALLDDMQRRYQLGNHSLHAVYQHRGLVAVHLGDLARAGHWFDEMVVARRDRLSDCATCVPSSHVAYLVAAGRYEEAVSVGTPHTNGGCIEQPQWILSDLLLAYLHTGRLTEAAQAHRKAYQRIGDNRKHLELVGLNLQFCGLTGNEEAGLPIVERHLPWLDRPSSPFAAMEFASGAALVLRRLCENGRGDVVVRRRSDDGSRRWESTVAQTHEELAALARSLAAEFDARNGNGYQGQRIEARLAAEPLVAELPLTVLTGRPIAAHPAKPALDALVAKVAELTASGDAAGAARTRLDVAFALRNAAQWADAVETAEEARRSLDAAGLTDDALAARYLLVELYERAYQQDLVRPLLEDLLAAGHLPASVPPRADLLERAARLSDPPRATEQLLEAAALHRESGDHSDEARVLALAAQWAQEPSPHVVALTTRLDELISGGHVDYRQQVLVVNQLCRLHQLQGDPQAALELAMRHAGPWPPLRVRAAELLLAAGRYAEAEQWARQHVARTSLGRRAGAVVAASLRGQGKPDEISTQPAEGDDYDDYDDDEGGY
jgi:tetratricopeptide (TPR) repeat protein